MVQTFGYACAIYDSFIYKHERFLTGFFALKSRFTHQEEINRVLYKGNLINEYTFDQPIKLLL